MKKLTLLSVLFVLFISQIKAQFELEKLFGGVNIGYAKPIGTFTDYAKGGLTYNAVVGYKLTDNIYVGGEYASVLTVALGNEENLFFGYKRNNKTPISRITDERVNSTFFILFHLLQ